MDLEECQFSDGWLKNFRKRYDIKHLKVSGEKNSADTEAAENYVEVFNKMVMEDKLLPSQMILKNKDNFFMNVSRIYFIYFIFNIDKRALEV